MKLRESGEIMSKTAFIGLGAMGGPMASNVARKLLAITVYDIVPAALARVDEAGVVFVSASSGHV